MENEPIEKVYIYRNSKDNFGSYIDISYLSGIHWDNISGGYKEVTGYYSLYAYIPYDIAQQYVSCSGKHYEYGNDAKVCIPKKYNNKSPYKETYQKLCEEAGEKPQSTMQENRPEGFPPCTKYILKLLNEQNAPITRKTLRNIIVDECGYESSTFRNAIKALSQTNRIVLKGDSSSPSQLISLP
jgi:hypothetical protein